MDCGPGRWPAAKLVAELAAPRGLEGKRVEGFPGDSFQRVDDLAAVRDVDLRGAGCEACRLFEPMMRRVAEVAESALLFLGVI